MRLFLLSIAYMSVASLTGACIPEEHDEITAGGVTAPPPRQLQQAQQPWPQRSAAEQSPTRSAPVAREMETTQKSFNRQLFEWYGQYSNYNLVLQDVKTFYPPLRYNGCVAFMSAALRRLGIDIPIAKNDPESPSLVTRPFSNYLENRLGWGRITNASSLSAGDIVFTRDNPSYPGYPAHVYMFHSWSNRSLGIALVVDNQDFTHERNIYDNDVGFNFTSFAYALRAP